MSEPQSRARPAAGARQSDGNHHRHQHGRPPGERARDRSVHAEGRVHAPDHGCDGSRRAAAGNRAARGQRSDSRSAPRRRSHASARLAARARARLRRASVPAACGCHRAPPARRPAARRAAFGARTAPSPDAAGSGAAHGAAARVRALASPEGVPARSAARAAHSAPEHEIRRRGVRSAVEVGQGRPAEGLRGLRRQRLGRRVRALHADVPVQPGGSAAEGALVRVLVGSRRGLRAVRAQHDRRRRSRSRSSSTAAARPTTGRRSRTFGGCAWTKSTSAQRSSFSATRATTTATRAPTCSRSCTTAASA